MASTRLGYVMVKRETTIGTAVQPTHAVRFKDGDIKLDKEIIVNDPIQNLREKAINAVPGKENTAGVYNVDLDPNESVHFLSIALGTLISADISSLTDASVFSHTMTVANSLPSITLEQAKGDPSDTSNDRQNVSIDRAYGVLVDSFTLTGVDGIINMELNMKAQGLFQRSLLIADATAGSSVDLSLESVEGLTTDDTVNIYDATPQSEQDAIFSIDTVNKTIQIATLGNSYTVANDAKVELTAQTPSYSLDARVFSFTNASFQFGDDLTAAASASEEAIEDWSFSFENNVEERFGSLRASPSTLAAKGNLSKLTFKKFFETVQERDRFKALSKQAGILTITDDTIVSATDTNDATYKLQIEMSDLRYTTFDMPTGTDELYAVELEATCFYDRTDGRSVRLIATNGLAGTEYTA